MPAKPRARTKKPPAFPKQMLLGLYDVFLHTVMTNPIGKLIVEPVGGGPFDSNEHWAFDSKYEGTPLNEELRVLRKTRVVTEAEWREFEDFLARPRNFYILAMCMQRPVPERKTKPKPSAKRR